MRKILVVEDEPVISFRNKSLLEKNGYQVSTVKNGEDAIEYLANQSFDLILMDIELDNAIDGIETSQIILENQHIPIVFLTSHIEKETIEKAKSVINYGYVKKNSSEHVLLETIQMAFILYESQKELYDKNEKLSKVLSQAPIGVFQTTIDGKIIYANDQFLSWFGYTLQEFKKINLETDFYIDKNKRRKFISLLNKYACVQDFHIRAQSKTQQPGEYIINAQLDDDQYTINGFLTNITKEKLNERKYRNLFDNSYFGILIIDFYTYEIKEANKKAEELFQITKDDLSHKYPWDLSPQLQPDGITSKEKAKQYLDEIKNLDDSQEFEWLHQSADGTQFDCQIELKKNNGTIIATVFDITDRKNKEKELESSRDEAVLENRENKLMLGEIHHRVKNDINIVKSLIELQMNQYPHLEEELEKPVLRLEVISELYEQIYGQENIDKINIHNFIDSMIENIKKLLDYDIDIICEVDSTEVKAKRVRAVGLIINELIINSYKHAFPQDKKDPQIIFQIHVIDEKIDIYYYDNGIGFKEIEDDGLGMNLIRSIVEYEYDGHISYTGENGFEAHISI
jgi:PAS domain S-box-containing protein